MQGSSQRDDTGASKFRGLLDEYWKTLEPKIMERANDMAKKSGTQLTGAHVGQAMIDVASGCPNERRSWWLEALPLYGTIVVAAVMALVFGGFALYGTGTIGQSNQAAFLDIAKVFAGAVVGSTTGAAVASTRK